MHKSNHSHAPDARRVAAKRFLSTIKEEAKRSPLTARNLIANSASVCNEAVAAILPSVKHISRTINRIKNKENGHKLNPRDLIELVIGDEYNVSNKGEQFLLFDSGPAEKRMLIFGTKKTFNY